MKYAICNETFEGWEHARVCGRVAELGYTGLEVAPFTLAPRITDVTAAQARANFAAQAEAAGVRIIGLHWLLAKTEGFHLTSADAAIRKRTGEYLAELARAAADLGGDILVLGSPVQRNIPEGHHPGAGRRLRARHALALPAGTGAGTRLSLSRTTHAGRDELPEHRGRGRIADPAAMLTRS